MNLFKNNDRKDSPDINHKNNPKPGNAELKSEVNPTKPEGSEIEPKNEQALIGIKQ